jgi:hypothetical protein
MEDQDDEEGFDTAEFPGDGSNQAFFWKGNFFFREMVCAVWDWTYPTTATSARRM